MRRPPRRGLAGAAATLAATLVALGLTAPASVAAGGRCAPGTGVTVVVDYGALGGGVVIACVPDGGGKSAAEVVTDAGFDLAYVSSQPGFVCRIDGRPGEADEDCGDTPPADAYWGLFWSDADPATWAYSSEGAGSLDVPAGGSIGWRFQDGGDREDPGAPPTGKAKTPSPQPTKSPQPAGASDAASPSPTPTPQASVPPGAGGSATDTPGEKANPEADKPGPKASGDKGDKAGDDTEGKGKGEGKDKQPPDKAHPEQAAAPEPSPSVAALSPASGEPLSDDDDSSAPLTLVAGAAVLLLASTAGVIAWRRRG
jgi:hypothetical protein